ncbi:AAA family ATPase [Erwinia persicina]|uniref:AAA family ATPase n=1 Tax=Erwinia persicina TaxID=55211 RepID=UPI0021032A94|nr:AAA family ATPase [Erwinia persicina]MCQ4106512.1 AAA family ATPase [Erwinia persicina]UTX14759.1 AAA family ATPase [Erwinia persicina]
MAAKDNHDNISINSALDRDLKSKHQLVKDFYDGKIKFSNKEIINEILKSINRDISVEKIKITEIGIFGVRGIEDLTLKIEDDITVIIGVNGSGKSTILDSISLTLSWLKSNIIRDEGAGNYLKEIDINNSSDISYASIASKLTLGKSKFSFLTTKTKSGRVLSRRSSLIEIKALGGLFRQVNSNFKDIDLPLVAHYSVARSNEGTKEDFAKVTTHSSVSGKWNKFDAYEDVLKDRHDFNEFIVWLSRIDSIARQGNGVNQDINRLNTEIASTKDLIKMFKEMNNDSSFIKPLDEIIKKKSEEISKVYNDNFNNNDILASKIFNNIKHAVSIFLPDINDVKLVYEQEGIKLILFKNGTEISAQQLSQGEKSLLSLIGDLTRRLVLLNPSLSNPLHGKGIVLIDEIDLHLHPSWQQTVILNLQKTFPNLQLIVTTHSPQVLSTVYSRSIRALKESADILNSIPELTTNSTTIISDTPTFQTRGVMSTDILSKIMDIDPVPVVDEAKWIHEYHKIIELDKEYNDESIKLWHDILTHFGDNHPVVVGCKNAIRLKGMKNKIQEIKRKKKNDE